MPAILQVNNVINYQQSEGATGNFESVKAQDIITADFQKSVRVIGSLLIVLQANNITDSGSRDFVLELQQRILNSPDIKNLQGVTTAYTASEMVIGQFYLPAWPYAQTGRITVQPERLPTLGDPRLHVANWNQSHSDSLAFNLTQAELLAYLQQQQADKNTTEIATSYYQSFVAFRSALVPCARAAEEARTTPWPDTAFSW